MGVLCHDNEECTKCEEELTCQFKIDLRNLTNFDPSTRKLKNLHFKTLFLTKIYNVWAKID